MLAGLAVLAALGIAIAGDRLIKRNDVRVGALPSDLAGETVLIPSRSGSTLHGWFLPGRSGAPAVMLLHSLHGSRKNMLSRARFLNRNGYAVLLFDFQANGESPGKHVTFGHLESLDAQAGLQFLRTRLPQAKIGVIGTSMGGAAALLAQPALQADALVLEAVYPGIEQAIANRLRIHGGAWAGVLTPALTLQMQPRIGVTPEALRPIDRVAQSRVPKLFIAGTEDLHTLPEESRSLFDAASQPKVLWMIENAGHVDFHAHASGEYEYRVLAFLEMNLR